MGSWAFLSFLFQAGALDEFWRQLHLSAQEDEVLLVSLIVLAASVLSAVLAPDERPHLRASLGMYVSGLFLMVAASAALAGGFPRAGKTIHGAAFLIGGFAMVKLAGILLFAILLRRTRLAPPQIVRDLSVAAGYIGVGVWLLSRNGVAVSSIITTSAVLTALLVFSLQDSLSNILGGLMMQLDETVKVGDWVKIDQTVGRVKDVSWRTISIETRNWETVIIPNGVLMKSQVVVLGRRSGQPVQLRRWVWFNVDFRVPPTEVIRTVVQALTAEPMEGAASEPKPNCVLMDFKESYCSYAARYWLTDLPKDDPTDSMVRARIYFALERAGIPLSVPAFTAFVQEESQEHKQLHHEREIQRNLSALDLAHVELFRTMTDDERRKLAERLRYTPFAKDEVMTSQGAVAHWLYIITKGSAEVLLSVDGAARKSVAVLHAGDFFGEMSLLTGSPRSATVKALEDSECYRLDRQAFEDILQGRPEIAQHLSEVLAKRQVELDAVRQNLDAAARQARMQHHQRSFFESIHKLFQLDLPSQK